MINYIWEKFSDAWLDKESLGIMKSVGKLVSAMKHRPFDPGSEKHKAFCRKQLNDLSKLGKQYPYLDLIEMEEYFRESGKVY
jgi:hypothetical protein